ncbi:S8 family serine peptidase [Natronomonas halophila]|uniref:S8 family serine peptidase n=1 Tax=Natronomonas halophila TaxID=2747817 RepID=UPI0015B4D509|nr:S8 family serine peptidase [Natronomonas halophila]QLD87406.1 S8 family serine peptidase [Natronomonas halophila]
MSGQQNDDGTNFSRRTFMKASGAVAGAGLLGANAVGSAAADIGPLDDRLLNWRVAEAKKVWEKGYRGRPDRTLGLTDSGVSARHPDLGPWNGARLSPDGNGGLEVQSVDKVEKEVSVTNPVTFDAKSFSGQNAGAGAVGLTNQTATFELPAQDPEDDEEIAGHGISATLSWNADTPEAQVASVEATLQRQTGDGYTNVASFGPDGLTVASSNEHELEIEVEADETYRFEVTTWRGIASWNIDVKLQKLLATEETKTDTVVEFDDFDGTLLPEEGSDFTTETPKTVAWYSETTRYGAFDIPRDQNGHGTHVSGIMTATGRASTIDPDRTEVYEENATVVPTDFLEYEVTARAGTSVFASAIGDGVVVEIVHDGETVHQSPLRFDSMIADAPTVHEDGEATYTVRVKPAETDAAVPIAEQAQAGNPLIGRLEQIAVGAYKHPAETTGDRTTLDESDDENETTVHGGVAPNFSLAGFQGLSGPAEDLGGFAEEAADLLNMRAVNMSWGPLLGAPVSAFGAMPSTAPAIRSMADAGILTVAAAGNSWTPANGNGEPAAVGEAISVVATDPFDGITGYSSGGIGQLNENQDGFDFKPDVTAPGGDIKPDAFATIVLGLPGALAPVDVPGVGTPTPDNVELVRATANPAPDADVTPVGDADSNDLDVPRDHRSIGGTSMASPYVCGVAGLVAQAMEEDAPDTIALPEPGSEEMGHEETMRLKQAILSTASTTAFTAAPYHNAQLVPSPATYTHGERDPYEGYGRVNPDAAVDAVTRDLLDTDISLGGDTESVTHEETVGLDVPFDSRAVAGYVQVPGGELTASVEFDSYGGGNAGMAAEDPHIDLFVYDAENPTDVGEPTILNSAVGANGTAEVSVSIDRGTEDEPTEDRTLFVVAKLVNVPGVVNGFDVQADFELGVEFTPADEFPQPTFSASGTRQVDSSVVSGNQANRVKITVSDLDDDAVIRDQFPSEWRLLPFGEGEEVADGVVEFREVDDTEVEGDNNEVTFTYFVESPSGVENSNVTNYGPAIADIVDDEEYAGEEAQFAGQDDVILVGADV